METSLAVVILVVIAVAVIQAVKKQNAEAKARAAAAHKIVCIYCATAGAVTTRATTVKTGISGGKTTGAALTGGLSLLAVGLSRRQRGQQLTCRNCRMSWFVA